jgi:alpha-glucosidase
LGYKINKPTVFSSIIHLELSLILSWNEYQFLGRRMNYYIHGPQMEDVVTNYTDLTGKPELPPLWALGYLNVSGVIFRR